MTRQKQPGIEALKAEFADKKELLADLDSGVISFPGSAFENREANARRRVDELEALTSSSFPKFESYRAPEIRGIANRGNRSEMMVFMESMN